MKEVCLGRVFVSCHGRVALAIALAMLSPLSYAQDTTGRIPQNPVVDDFGVDVQGNGFLQEFKELSIGPDDHKGLQHIRYLTATGWKTNFWHTAISTTAWLHPFPSAVAEFGSLTRVSGETGYTRPVADGSSLQAWIGPAGLPWMLSTKDGRVVEYDKITFDYGPDSTGYSQQSRAATRVTFPDGTIWTIHNLYYTDGPIVQSRIQSVTNNLGYQMKYEYDSDVYDVGNWKKITKVIAINNAIEYCDPMVNRCALSQSWPSSSYSFSGGTTSGGITSGEIESFTDASGRVTQFQTESNGFYSHKSRIKRPGSSVWDAEYTLVGVSTPCYPEKDYPNGNCLFRRRVSSATIDGVSRSYSYSYSPSLHTWTVQSTTPYGTRKYVSQTDSYWGIPNGVAEFVDELGRSSKFEYSPYSQLIKSTSPEGNYASLVRDANANITEIRQVAKPGSGLPNLVSTSVFGTASMGRPTSTLDNKGNESNFEYSSVHGGILKRIDPAVNGIRPETRYEYAQRHAWIKNGSGAYVQVPAAVWMLTRERFCKTTAASGTSCTGGALDEVVTDYDYGPDSGPNNLLLRGIAVTADGETLRTCYGYDISGRKISETKPAANLTSCP